MSVRLEVKIPSLLKALEPVAAKVVDQTARDVVNTMKSSMMAKKSGRIYRRRTSGPGATTPSFGSRKMSVREHQASAPGQAPAVDTADLFKSLTISEDGPLVRIVTVEDEKGVLLEYGTSRMAPRPFFGRSFLENARPFHKNLRDALNEAMNDAQGQVIT